MSDDDREIDIESDEEDDDQDNISLNSDLTGRETSAEKRAHHNALERKRRDHIKESFTSLRDSVPTIQGEKVVKASRAQILKKATEYIQIMKQRNHKHQQEIDDIRSQNRILEQQVSALEKVKSAGAFAANQSGQAADSDSGASEETVPARPRRKKAKV